MNRAMALLGFRLSIGRYFNKYRVVPPGSPTGSYGVAEAHRIVFRTGQKLEVFQGLVLEQGEDFVLDGIQRQDVRIGNVVAVKGSGLYEQEWTALSCDKRDFNFAMFQYYPGAPCL